MYPRAETVSITTDGAGAATAYTGVFSGEILAVSYIKDTWTGTPAIVLTTETTLQAVLSVSPASSGFWRPRALVQKAADGTDTTTYEPVYAADERVKIEITGAGATLHGTIIVTYA